VIIGNFGHDALDERWPWKVENFDGRIKDAAIWDEALNSSEVAALYNSGTPFDVTSNSGDYASSANLKGYWRFAENTGTTAYDLSGNGNHGTIKGATCNTEAPAAAPVKVIRD
jgi:hypothetical protein